MATKRGWIVGGNGQDHDSQLVEYEERESATRHDWKALAALGSFVLALLVAALTIQYRIFIGDVRQLLDAHTIERQQWRGNVDARISRIEEQCQANHLWRDKADGIIDGLQVWRNNCGAKQARFDGWIEQHDRQEKAVIDALNRRQDWLEQQLTGRRGQ